MDEYARTLIPAVLFMKACPPQAVFAHLQSAPIIVNVFVVGYSLVKVQLGFFKKNSKNILRCFITKFRLSKIIPSLYGR